MIEVESFQNSNMEESEFGALHALHLNENAIAAARAKLGNGPSLTHCSECGEEIPEKRRQVIKGCKYCVTCQELYD